MKNEFRIIALLAVLLFTTGCDAADLAQTSSASDKKDNQSDKQLIAEYDDVEAKLRKILRLNVSAIADAPVDGLLQVVTDRGLFYTSKDGKYFMQARVFNLDEDMRDETDAALSQIRLDGIKQFDDSVIEFKAKNEKFAVTVFTDISCGYCRKFHEEIAEYNDKGITVRYLAFPRGGLRGDTYDQMVSVWCAKDQQAAMTNAKSGDRVPSKDCASNVNQQYAFGQKIGINGTPNIILPNGSLIPGYQPAAALKQTLEAL